MVPRRAGQGLVKPLLFVNWRRVHARFCVIMWIIAVILAAVVIAHLAAPSDAANHAAATVR
jgi:hypothetical protein